MNFRVFSTMTLAGSFLWCLILAKFSQYIFRKHQGQDLIGDPNALVHVIKHESLPIIAFIVILCALYAVVMKLTAPKAPKSA